MWQDKVISACQFLFLVALIPSIISEEKPALWSCILTALLLTVIAFTQWTLHLYFSMVSGISIASGWWVLTYQQFKRHKTALARSK